MLRTTIPGSARMPAAENLPNGNDCLFCPKPKKITDWWYESSLCRVIDKPSGEPMVILNRHTTTPTDAEMLRMEEVVESLFGSHELAVHMGHVTDHWHAHIRNYEKSPDEAL